MYKQAIRNNESPRNPKPRVFDVIVRDDGGMEFEVKNGKQTEIIDLCDVLRQILEILQRQEEQHNSPAPPSKS